MLTFVDSFEHYVTADLPKKWTTASAGATIVSTPTPPTGTKLLSVASAHSASKTNPNGQQTSGVACFSYRTSGLVSNNGMCQIFSNATAHLTIYPNASGFIELRLGTTAGTIVATSTDSISADTWYHIKITWTIHDSTGSVEVFVNGTKTDWIDYSGDTRNGTPSTWDRVSLYGFR
jgi:hypothetical protein